jgi:polyhydroxybutyrate depolymerase
MKALIIIGCILLLLAALYFYFVYAPTPPPPALTSSPTAHTIQAGGRTRTFLTYRPQQPAASPGLVIVMHGTGIDGEKMRAWTGYEFEQAADQQGFLIVYPDGYKKDWNDCRKGYFSDAKKENVDDIAFINAIISKYNVSPDKVFLFGYSAGGMMAYRIAMEQPHSIAAIATVCAALPTPETNRCTIPDTLPPIMMVNGTADKICPANGGELNLFGAKRGVVVSAVETGRLFAGKSAPKEVHTGNKYTWGDKVVLHLIQGGGHVIPQPLTRFPRIMGNMKQDIDAPAAAIRFFGFNP